MPLRLGQRPQRLVRALAGGGVGVHVGGVEVLRVHDEAGEAVAELNPRAEQRGVGLRLRRGAVREADRQRLPGGAEELADDAVQRGDGEFLGLPSTAPARRARTTCGRWRARSTSDMRIRIASL